MPDAPTRDWRAYVSDIEIGYLPIERARAPVPGHAWETDRQPRAQRFTPDTYFDCDSYLRSVAR